jgi:hypothetical protein
MLTVVRKTREEGIVQPKGRRVGGNAKGQRRSLKTGDTRTNTRREPKRTEVRLGAERYFCPTCCLG